MSTRRRKRKPLPTPLKNTLASSRQPFWVISEVRRKLSDKQLEALAAYMVALASMGRPAFPSLQAKRLQELRPDGRELSPLPLSAELHWTTAVLVAHSAQINLFLSLKATFEDHALAGDFDSALSSLDQLDANGGHSLLTIELRQSILQLSGGLGTQKEYLRSVVTARTVGDAVAYLAFHGSLRNEPTTQIFSFREHFSKEIESATHSSPFRTWLLYHICDQTPISETEVADMLRVEQGSSILDLYETFVRCATSLSAHNATSFAKFFPSLQLLSEHIADNRLFRLTTLSRYSEEAAIAVAALPASSLSHLALDTRSITNARISEQDLTSASTDDTDRFNGTLQDQIKYDIDNLTGQEFGIRSFFRLMRLAANFRMTAIPSIFYVDAMDQVNQGALRDNTALTFAYVYGRYVQPAHLHLLCKPAREMLAERLMELNPNSLPLTLMFHELGLAIPAGAFEAVPTEMLENACLTLLATDGRWSDVVERGRALLSSTNEAVRRNAARHLANALIEENRIAEAVEFIVTSVLEDDFLSYRLPISTALQRVDRDYRKQFAAELSTPILYQLLRNRDSKTESFRTYAYEDFLTAHRVSKPSELGAAWRNFDRNQAVFYLRSVCTPETMQMSSAFVGSKDYEDERIAICALLADLDPTNAKEYEAESSAITQHQIIRGGVKQVEEKKIYVDTEGIRQWAYTNLRESWDRYQALRASGLEPANSAVLDAIREVVKKVAPGTLVLSLPQNETTTLFVSMLDKLRTEFQSNPKSGLDCYLSMRVRHGSLAGLLRSALESNCIITQRDSTDSMYTSNYFWRDRLNHLSDEAFVILNQYLSDFSKSFDDLIDEYTNNFVQIATAEKPDGLIFLDIPETRIAVLIHTLSADSTFEEFVEGAFRLFSDQLDFSLTSVRSHIETYLQPKSAEIFATLEQQLTNFGIPQIQELDAAVHAAHTELQQTITQLRQWFHRSEPEKGPDFTFDELVKIGLTCVSRIHDSFSPKLAVVSPLEDLVFSDLAFFSDIFFIVFDNARIHSGLVEPEVTVRGAVEHDSLHVQVRSQVAAHRDLNQIIAKVNSIRSTIQKGGYHKAVRSEGGTGLIKLRNILEWGPEGDSILRFSVDETLREFVVDMKVPLLLSTRRTVEVV